MRTFELEDNKYEDISLPLSTEIGYSNSKSLRQIFLCLCLAALSFYYIFILKKDFNFIGLGLTFISTGGIILGLFRFFNKTPMLIIDSNGIFQKKTGFISWENILNEEVKKVLIVKSFKTYLMYMAYDESVKFDLEGLNIEKSKLEKMLITYRIRHEKLKHL